jgi:hypothetical protein
MNQPKEVSWESIFARPKPKIEMHFAKKCTCGNKTCQAAKKIKCTCRCHSENHGAANRAGMEPLDKTLELDKTDTETLDSQPEILRLDSLVSRELIYVA